ncbi:MAG: DUF881 domain-containing protein [Aeromicrobium sp.]
MPPELPTRKPTGLLESIAQTSLDDDYYEFRPRDSARSGGLKTVASGVGIALFASLVTIAVVQNRSDRQVNQVERNTLVSDIRIRKATIDKGEAEVSRLRSEVAKLRTLSSSTDPEFEDLQVTTGDVGASGPGIVVVADNSTKNNTDGDVTDIDLQILVNGLWYAGAEAISINGNRLTTLSSIRRAGQAITVNFRSIGPPYRVIALGNEETLADRLSENSGGQYWAERARTAGLRYDVQNEAQLSVPAAPAKRVTITYAQAIEGDK